MKFNSKQIPPERRTLYYIGMAVAAFGLILFLSNFILGPIAFMRDSGVRPGEFGFRESMDDDFRAKGQAMVWFAARAVGGMVLMILGSGMMSVAARGMAGSGLTLNPEQARKDFEPWNRMAGGMTQDALSEINVVQKIEDRLDQPAGEAVVKVRCRRCQSLNDETAKYCNQCGAAL